MTAPRAVLGPRLFQALALLVLLLALGVAGRADLPTSGRDGAGRLSWEFLTSFPSRRAADAGICHALIGQHLRHPR